jgi:ubiquitin carboxyl-terminal hydrolase 5/13
MTMMGLPEKKCRQALKNCDKNLERAIDWAFSHMDDPDEDDDAGDGDAAMQLEDLNKAYECDKAGHYELQSFVTHLGASVHAGHYVCHIKKPVDISS